MHLFSASDDDIRAMRRQSAASPGLILVIVVVLLAVVVIAVDLTCFFTKKRGIIATLHQRFGPSATTRGATEKALEDGEK
jgi:NADH:ubiquinone oxidoreductase subunit H